jgi:ABC-2 type transport system ATP-binding protein
VKDSGNIRIEFKDVAKGGFHGRLRSASMAARLLSNPARVIRGKTSFTNYDRHILNGVSFTVRKGECLAIVGGKGSGKTTLAKMTVGMVRPDAGHIEVVGKPLLVSQLGKFHKPMLTAREALSLSIRLYSPNLSNLDDVVERAFDFSELRKFEHTLLYDLEKWQIHRLAFAALLFTPTDLYVFDELFSGGDAVYKEKCFARVQELVANNTALIFTRHLDIASTLSSRLLFLEDGKLCTQLSKPLEDDGSGIDMAEDNADDDSMDDELSAEDGGGDLTEDPSKINDVISLKSVTVDGRATHYLSESLLLRSGETCDVTMEFVAQESFQCEEFNLCIHTNLVRAPLLVTHVRPKKEQRVWKFTRGHTYKIGVRLTVPNLGKGLYSLAMICRNRGLRPYEGFLKLARFGLLGSEPGFSGSILIPSELRPTGGDIELS